MSQANLEDILASVRCLPITFDADSRTESATKLIYAVRPEWQQHAHQIKITPFSEGLMNHLLQISCTAPERGGPENDETAIMLRSYGGNTDLLVNRDVEVVVHKLLEREGLAAPLLARFENGLLYQFTPGSVCRKYDIRQPQIWKAIAATLGEWHARLPRPSAEAKLKGNPLPTIWEEMERWLSNVPTERNDSRTSVLRREVERSRKELENVGLERHPGLVLGHTDLLTSNIIVSWDDGDNAKVRFIDYEFAGPCAAAYDLANHFAEWVGFKVDYSLIPTRWERQQFIEVYLRAYDSHSLESEGDFEQRVHQLMDDVDRYRGIPGLRWGIQAIVQEYLNIFPHFDFAGYGGKRLMEYWATIGGSETGEGMNTTEMSLRECRWAQETLGSKLS